MLREISTEMTIHASPHRIWDILTDFSSYSQWNNFLLKVQGEVGEGNRIRFKFELPRGLRGYACATVLKVVPKNELRWAGGIRGIFKAEHYFLLERMDDKTVRFHHGEIFTGFLVPIVWRLLLARGGPPVYEEMNVALKKRAEMG